MKQQTFGRSRPSIAHELHYRRSLDQLIAAMQKDVDSKVRSYYRSELAADAASARWVQIMKALRLKWYREFERNGKELATWFADKTKNRTASQISRKLKDFGFTVRPEYGSTEQELIKQIVAENVGMIKSIPQQYLRDVQKVTASSFSRGQDMAALTKHLDTVLTRLGDNTKNRAALIARDQTNKATQQLAVAGAKSVGATKGRWIHIPGKYSSRRTHIAMNNKVFDLSEGLYDSEAHRNVKPGELIYCNCQFAVLMPGFDD